MTDDTEDMSPELHAYSIKAGNRLATRAKDLAAAAPEPLPADLTLGLAHLSLMQAVMQLISEGAAGMTDPDAYVEEMIAQTVASLESVLSGDNE